MNEFSYSLKWDIKMSISHKEMMLNLLAQGHFGKLFEMLKLNDIKAIEVFTKEIHDMQSQFVIDNLDYWGME